MSSHLRPGIYLHSQDVQVNPFPTYERMRDSHPVCQVEPNGFWAISRYEDVKLALRSPEIFSSAAILKLYQPDWLRQEAQRNYSIFSQDPPAHTENRTAINKAFVSGVIKRFIPIIDAAAGELVSKIEPGLCFDFLRDFSARFALGILNHVTGLEGVLTVEELMDWLELSESLNTKKPDVRHITALERMQIHQKNCLRQVLIDRKERPRQDLVSELLAAEVSGQPLPDEEVISLLELLLGAGFDTVSYSLCHAIVLLSEKPHLHQLLRTEPSAIPKFIEELMRFDPPTHSLLRETTVSTKVSGVTIPEGSLVLLMLGAANRDPLKFSEPDTFDMERANIKEHVAFGAGPHACIGAALARLEIQIALEHLIGRFSRVQCPEPAQLTWVSGVNVHAPKALPVCFDK